MSVRVCVCVRECVCSGYRPWGVVRVPPIVIYPVAVRARTVRSLLPIKKKKKKKGVQKYLLNAMWHIHVNFGQTLAKI